MRTKAASYIVAVGVGILLIGSATPALASKSKAPSSAEIKALTKSLNSAKHLTYEATYKSVNGGQTTTVTIAQAPPKSTFSTSSGSVIDTGSKTYFCSGSSTNQQCLSEGGSNPFSALEALFSPTLALEAFGEAKDGLLSRSLGIKVNSSSASFAGQASTCVSVTVKSNAGKYCVTKQGLLSYSGSTSGYFELTKYSKSPPSSLFTLPTGATTVTLPGGTSITLPGGGSIP
jgi:hypothetical protein